MGDKTLGDCVGDGSLNGQIFVSSKPISGDRQPMHYKVDKLPEADEDIFDVFPVDYDRRKPVARDESVGVLYSQHKGDLVLN